MAEAVHRTCGPVPVPGPGGWSSDHAALLPPGGAGTSERTLLLLLLRPGSVRQGPGRCRGPEAVGGQRGTVWTLLRRNDRLRTFERLLDSLVLVVLAPPPGEGVAGRSTNLSGFEVLVLLPVIFCVKIKIKNLSK